MLHQSPATFLPWYKEDQVEEDMQLLAMCMNAMRQQVILLLLLDGGVGGTNRRYCITNPIATI